MQRTNLTIILRNHNSIISVFLVICRVLYLTMGFSYEEEERDLPWDPLWEYFLGDEDTVESFGRLTTLVCNAATFTDLAPIDELEEEEWRRALDVNLTGVFLTAKMGVPHLRAHGGSIILIASQMGRVATPGQSAYCATKGALLQLAKVMALDLAPDGIRVNTLSPGAVATERLARRFGSMEAAEREMAPKHPINRLGRPEEVASAAVFLASDESSFMTGADLLIDGGYSAW